MNTKIKLILILLLTTALSIHGETIDGNSIKLGAKTIPFSEEYGVWTIPENSKKYVCFSIMRPEDLKITVSMASSEKSEPLMMLFATFRCICFVPIMTREQTKPTIKLSTSRMFPLVITRYT